MIQFPFSWLPPTAKALYPIEKISFILILNDRISQVYNGTISKKVYSKKYFFFPSIPEIISPKIFTRSLFFSEGLAA